MNITCIYPQRKIEGNYSEALKEYEKRLQRYCKIKFISEKAFSQKSVPKTRICITDATSSAMQLSSEEFAAFINRQGLEGNTNLTFYLTENAEPDEICFSLCHAPLGENMLLVLLAEQIYRAFRIIHNHSYHK